MNYIKSYIIKPTIPNFYVPSFCRGCWIFDSTTNKIIDYSQYANHGTNNGSFPVATSNFFNGINSYIALPNSKSLDITSAPLAVFATLKVRLTASFGYVLSKNLDLSANVQYGFYWDTTNLITVFMEGIARTSSIANSVSKDIYHNVGFVWDGTNVNAYVDFSQSGTSGTFSGNLTSRPNIAIGRRASSGYFNGNVANISIYASADTDKILNHQKILSNNLI